MEEKVVKEEKKVKKSHKLLKIILVLGVILGLAGGGAYLYFKEKFDDQKENAIIFLKKQNVYKCSEYTLDELLNNYITDLKWDSKYLEENKTLIILTGSVKYEGKDADVYIEYEVEDEDYELKTYKIDEIIRNDKSLADNICQAIEDKKNNISNQASNSENNNPKPDDTENNDPNNDSEYDQIIKNFETVTAEEALDLYDRQGTYVLYIGRKGCSHCEKMVPSLKELQDELGYKTYYYELTESFREDAKDLAEKFTLKLKVNGEEDTIGNLLIENGYTPTVVIIKDGKTVDGFIGERSKDKLKEMIYKYL